MLVYSPLPSQRRYAMSGLNSSLLVLADGPIGCLFLFCWPAPLIGFLIGCLRHGTPHVVARWRYVLAYYIFALGSLGLDYLESSGSSVGRLLRTFDVVVFCVFFGATVCGPFLGVWMIRSSGPRRPRFPIGQCQSCGYNLTGNVSGVCSECGTPTATS